MARSGNRHSRLAVMVVGRSDSRSGTTSSTNSPLRNGVGVVDWQGTAASALRILGQPELESVYRDEYPTEASLEHSGFELVAPPVVEQVQFSGHVVSLLRGSS